METVLNGIVGLDKNYVCIWCCVSSKPEKGDQLSYYFLPRGQEGRVKYKNENGLPLGNT